MTDSNTPARRERREAARLNNQDEFYFRGSVDEVPIVANRRIRPHGACKLCRLIPSLMEDNGYTFEEARDVERDLYRFIYTFWGGEDISRWLKRTHEYSVSHDSVSRHISKHIPDPSIAMLDRVSSYRPDFMNKKFFLNLSDTMKLFLMRYQAGVATGAVPISTQDFVAVAKTLKEWQEFLSDLNEDKTDLFMQAVSSAIDRTLDPYPDIKSEFIRIFREEVEKIEKGS